MHSVAPRDHPAGLIDAQPDLAYGRGATGALYLARAVGRMAEWLCRGLQILVRRFDSASGLHFLKAQLISQAFLAESVPPDTTAGKSGTLLLDFCSAAGGVPASDSTVREIRPIALPASLLRCACRV
jgi:hypothetical protein